jgi:thioesterase domain-containing protein
MRPLAAAISTDRIIGSLHVPGMDSQQAPPDSIESLADLYLAEILRVQPVGPYTLIGRCTGGIVAYEIALKLQVLGEQVQNLVLVETLPFPGCARPDIDQESIAAWHYHRQQEIRREIELRLENAPAVVAQRCREIQDVIDRAVINYAPEGVFDGDATLCRSEADRHQFQLLWGTLIQGRLTTIEVPGNHATMFESPMVVHLAKVLSRIICPGT